MHLFFATFTSGVIFKNLIELLHNNSSTLNFTINPNGIFICEQNQCLKIETLIDVKMIEQYHYNFSESSKEISVNIKHALKILKSVKKNEKLDICILESSPNMLRINAHHENHISKNVLKILTRKKRDEDQKVLLPGVVLASL